ncbi:MAG: SNF2-related protein [Leptospiraceae bacterium]|nr:SNF2-related protein [Leptospiraceae bacterium]
MLKQGYQFTLDFDKKTENEIFYQFAFIKNKPELGIGKLISRSGSSFQLEFQNSILEVTEEEITPIQISTNVLYKQQENPILALTLSATELKLAHSFNKLSSLSNSRTRLLPHQLESTYVVVNSLRPRFILADEVGLGKTIEAALVMKELMFRNKFSKVLVVCPSPLQVQWQQELKNKFNEEFSVIKRKNFLTNGKENWQNFSKIITSIDFIKNPNYANEILKKKWDIVIFDEAHRLRRDYSKITRAYLFAEKISKKTEALLLLTATPFRGKLEELFYLVHLVDPNILGPYHSFVNDYVIGSKSDLKEKVSKVLLRRRKVEVGGFTKRFAKTVKLELSTEERNFYDETTEYVKQEYNLAMKTKNRAIGFVMVVFQKLLDSSVHALLNALTKRKYLLENKLHRFKPSNQRLDEWDTDETENVEEFLEDLDESVSIDLNNIRRELLTLNRLIHLGKKIKEDQKSLRLKETLLRLKKEGHKKFIIFTQFRTTQDYLFKLLADEFKTSLFHGSLSMDAKEEAIQDFKSSSEILICTEAGGEGRNLQFANILFNYDLPWSPLKVEQRIGRIHRFGQKENVYIFNFASKDTVAERILEVLTNKIKLFEESIGASDTLLGAIEDELDFNSNLMKFVTGVKTKEELEQEIDSKVKIAEIGYKKLDSLLTPKLVDFNLQDYYNHTLSERSFDNSHLEKFLLEFDFHLPNITGAKLEPADKKVYRIYWKDNWKLATFDSEEALKNDSLEFLAFGHPLVENAIEYFQDKEMGRGFGYLDSGKYSGKIYFIFLSHFKFSLSRTEILYYEFDSLRNTILKLNSFEPKEFIIQRKTNNETNFHFPEIQKIESAFCQAFKRAKEDSEILKNQILEKTKSMFLREEYKVELSGKKAIRELTEKLDRQEAKVKWSGKPEQKSVISRTKNEILRKKEDFEIELNKIRNGREISSQLELFQVYIGPNFRF